MELKMNSKSWHAKLYKSTYDGYEMPNNICGYFWWLILAIILAIPCWPGHIWNWICGKYNRIDECAAWKLILHIPASFLIGIIIYVQYYNRNAPKWFNTWGWYPIGCVIGALTVVLFILIIVGVIVLVTEVIEPWLIKRKPIKGKMANPVVEGWRAFKGKYCSKIKWE